jgi:hypothetical protein
VNDAGTQCASIIFCSNAQQTTIANKVKKELQQHIIDKKTVTAYYATPQIHTDVVNYTEFYPAQNEHQEYFWRKIPQAIAIIVCDSKTGLNSKRNGCICLWIYRKERETSLCTRVNRKEYSPLLYRSACQSQPTNVIVRGPLKDNDANESFQAINHRLKFMICAIHCCSLFSSNKLVYKLV